MGLTDLCTGFAFPGHRHGSRQSTANRILTILQFNYTITAACFELFFADFQQIFGFSANRGQRWGGGMRAPLGACLRQDTGPHPAFTCMACPATVQTAAERFRLFCSDNGFLFSSAAFAPRFVRICFRGPEKAFWCRRLCPLAS